MKQRIFTSLLLSSLVALASVGGQSQSVKPADPELDKVEAMIGKAKKESEAFVKKGGKPGAADDPNLKWANLLWQYRLQHAATPATTRATRVALDLLSRADKVGELQANVDTLKLDDPAWRQVLYVLVNSAARQHDNAYLYRQAQMLFESAADRQIRAQAGFMLGEAYWKSGDQAHAKVTLQAVASQFADTPYADQAKGDLNEIENLNPGQPAPSFSPTTINGAPIALASFKGQVVVLKFWGSY
ncbi:MAG TPA: hypothetical protein VKD91_05415 [Pyrinomonadaceae bacterium]|nr:hypothetical protein [Pyrinomonadaceae bacterium]